MAQSTLIVTGAVGYVGRHVVRAGIDRGCRVVALTRSGAPLDFAPEAEVIRADVLDEGFDVSILPSGNDVAMVHLAWSDGFAHNASSHMLNLSAHFRFLSRVVEHGVGKLSVLGTMHEVGYWEGPITADTPTNPLSLYGIAKDALRRACLLAFSEQTEVSWLRCFYIYGDDRNNNSIFTRLLERVDRGESTMPFTSGKNLYDFIRVDELARQIVAVAVNRGLRGVVNCCSGSPTSLAEQVEAFIGEQNLPIRLEYGAFPDRPYDSPGVWGDATEIRALTASEG